MSTYTSSSNDSNSNSTKSVLCLIKPEPIDQTRPTFLVRVMRSQAQNLRRRSDSLDSTICSLN